MDDFKSKPEKAPVVKELDIYQDIANAAAVGGNEMASSEPFGPLIGAAIGAVEEGIALLTPKKPRKD